MLRDTVAPRLQAVAIGPPGVALVPELPFMEEREPPGLVPVAVAVTTAAVAAVDTTAETLITAPVAEVRRWSPPEALRLRV